VLRASLVAVAAAAAMLVGAPVVSSSSPKPPATASHCAKRFPTVIRDGFPEPPMRFSSGGRLDTTLRMARGPATIDGHAYQGAETYEGTFPGPTLVMCPGDRVTVHLINDLGEPTNLHVHGLHVSPAANHDNVFLHVEPGARQTYTYHLPLDHDPGAFWYHPHHHMFVAPQIFGGLSGAIVVEGGLDDRLAGVPQRLMMIQSTELCRQDGSSVPFPLSAPNPTGAPDSGTEPCSFPGQVMPVHETNERFTPLLVNGAINPTVKIRPGQIQRWRIFNANDNRIVVLNLRGQNLDVLAEDGNTLRWRQPVRNLLIGPGSRREVLVRGGSPGEYKMTALPFAQFPGGDHADLATKGGGPTPNQTVLTVVSTGPAAHDRVPPRPLAAPVDLRTRRVDRTRTICFAEANPMNMQQKDSVSPCTSPQDTGPPTDFKLNGKTFDAKDVAVTMKLGSVEEWRLVNSNTEWHTFHIHVNPFQVISVGGRRVPYVDYEDNVAMPPSSTVVIRMRPTDFTGKFVFHCHVTNHEDRGMMAAVAVVRSPTPAQRRASVATGGGLSVRSSALGAPAAAAAAGRRVALLCRLLGLPTAGIRLSR
jgi:FtsP/CotA-like multicopper oxidase with cupredoxin domain